MEKQNQSKCDFFRAGTPKCGLLTGFLGLILAFFLLFLGFWKTLFVVLFCGAGFFLGAIDQKKEWLKKKINGWFPPKDE